MSLQKRALFKAFDAFIDSLPPNIVEENVEEIIAHIDNKYRPLRMRVKSRQNGEVLGFTKRPEEMRILLKRAFSIENYQRVVKNGGGDLSEIKLFLDSLREIDASALVPTYERFVEFLRSLSSTRYTLVKSYIVKWAEDKTGAKGGKILQNLTERELTDLVEKIRDDLRVVFPNQEQYAKYMENDFLSNIDYYRPLELSVGGVEISIYNKAKSGEENVVIPRIPPW